MLEPWIIVACSLFYIGILFVIAYFGDIDSYAKKLRPYRGLIYSLSLAVYCTSWTYYGAVGSATTDGWRYTAIYLGPILLIVFGYRFLKKVATICTEQNITSIADFIASRYGKSQFLAILVTLIAITGTLPYIALQLKAIASSYEVLTNLPPSSLTNFTESPSSIMSPFEGIPLPHSLWNDTGLIVAMVMAVFCILFGTRYVNSSEHHEGLILAIAFESIIKILALALVATLAMFIIFDSPPNAIAAATQSAQASQLMKNSFSTDMLQLTFLSHTVLALAAIFCLPRQFHVSFVEITDANHLKKARWVFPGYLLLTTVLVIPIAIAGSITHSNANLPDLITPDMYVLTLPISGNNSLLAMFAFIGGFSAATSMVIVAVITLSTMLCNDIVMPLLFRFRSLKLRERKDLTGLLLAIRRIAIVIILTLGYFYYQYINRTEEALASIGLTAFVAAIQFAPAIIGAVYWKRATRKGAIAGLIAGFSIWLYTLFLPSVLNSSDWWIKISINGPFGIEALRPNNLFYIDGIDLITHSLIFSLGLNIIGFIIFSWQRKPELLERIQAANFTQTSQQDDISQGLPWWSTVAVGELRLLAEKFVGETATRKAFNDYTQARTGELVASEKADADLVRFTERLLSGAIGSSSARVIINSVVNKRKDLPLEDVFSIVDESSQARQFNEDLLNTTIEHIDQGISVLDENYRLVAWNSRYLELYKYPKNFIRVGRPVEDMIRHNAKMGECGPGSPDSHINKRLEFMRAGAIHSFQRYRADGSVLQIQGRPLPNGGFVTSFTDITEYKKAELELRDINENLELLVTGRTHELSQVNDKLQRANRSKTRFLAAVNHDVMQPLNAARLFTAALSQTGDEQIKLTKRINSSLDSAEEIIKTLIDISKLDGGSISANITKFRVSDVLDTLYKEFAVIAENKKIELNRVPCEAVIETDAHLLRRVLQNFIGNALRYTKPGGRVSFGCRRKNLDSKTPEIQICVFDTGVGIPEGELSAIFEEFHQLDNQITEEVKGVGLGLSIAKRISQILDHSIGIKSTLGKGSLFSLTVPFAIDQKADSLASDKQQAVAPSLSLPIAGLDVLCIDNDADILDGMSALLERWSCTAHCAKTLEIALDNIEIQNYEPDILLVDYDLGRSSDNGLVLLQKLQKQLPSKPPGVLITADVSEAVMQQAKDLGFEYLRKPVNPVILRKLMMKLTR